VIPCSFVFIPARPFVAFCVAVASPEVVVIVHERETIMWA
jgi:hypothetical protein